MENFYFHFNSWGLLPPLKFPTNAIFTNTMLPWIVLTFQVQLYLKLLDTSQTEWGSVLHCTQASQTNWYISSSENASDKSPFECNKSERSTFWQCLVLILSRISRVCVRENSLKISFSPKTPQGLNLGLPFMVLWYLSGWELSSSQSLPHRGSVQLSMATSSLNTSQ